jgi:cytochrome c oxidase subunit IV
MDSHNADHAGHQPHSYKKYFVTWCWLLGMTLLALGIGYMPIAEGFRGFLLVCVTLAKIFLIASIFMHLNTERLNLVMLTFTPLILSIILFFITFGESAGSSTHVIVTHGSNPPAAVHAEPHK